MGNNLTAVDLGTGRTAVAISAGERHICAVLVRTPPREIGEAGDCRIEGALGPPPHELLASEHVGDP